VVSGNIHSHEIVVISRQFCYFVRDYGTSGNFLFCRQEYVFVKVEYSSVRIYIYKTVIMSNFIISLQIILRKRVKNGAFTIQL
jgi:hypothetical protein